MKMLKPFFGPQDCGSMFATSPTAPTRRLPPVLGCPAGAAAAVGAGLAAPALVGAGAVAPVLPAAGATWVGAGGATDATPQAAASVTVVTVDSRLSAWRRVKRFAARAMWSSP